MANNKDNQKTGAKGSMSDKSDREFKGQGQDSKFGQGQQAGGSQKGTNPNFKTEDDDMTSGGREGQFSDKDKGQKGQWSPGSNQASDQ